MSEQYVTEQAFREFLKEETDHHKRAEEAGTERGKQIQDLGRKIDSVVRWRPRAEEELKVYRKTLFGNGEPGWDEIIRRMAAFMDKQEAKEKEAWSEGKKLFLGALAVIINTIITAGIVEWLGK